MSTSPSTATARSSSGAFRITPAEIWRMFRERWIIGLLLGAIAAALVIYFQPKYVPIYRTEVYLLFSQRKDRVLNITEVVDTSLQTIGELNTHVEQLRSKTFFEYLLTSFTADETKRIQAPYIDPTKPDEAPPSLAAIIRPNVQVFVRKGTTILGISVANRDPESAALIANRYARKYIDYNLDRANTGTNSAIVFLRNQSEEMRRQVEAAEVALQEYRARYNMAALGENQNVVIQKMSSLGNALVTAQMDQLAMKTVIETIDRHLTENRSLIEIPQVLSFGRIAAAKAGLDTLRARRLVLEERYLPRHPLMKENDLEAAELRRQIGEDTERAVAELRARHETSLQYEKQLRNELLETEAFARNLDKISVDYKFLEQEAATKRSSYTRITDRLNEASISSQMEDINIKIFDAAWVATMPNDEKLGTTFIIAGSAFFGCLFLVPIGLGFLDTRIKTPMQIESALGEKLIGGLPRIKRLSSPERAQAFLHEKDGNLTESYRGLYSEIEIASTLAYPKSIMITSSLPNEGKSLVSCNLASVFASHGRRTLLIDCDLRRPTLHTYFETPGEIGWTQWLMTPPERRPSLPAGIVNITTRLDLLPAGGSPANSTQLLDQLASADVQKKFLATYDLVIFDTPPATIFPDALLLARCCHELLYVCQYSRVRLNTVKRALAHLRSTGIRPLGVLLNQMPAASADNGYYGYGSKSAKYYKAYAERPSA
jgi:succinoglycan biosynthesis transport protein ExoP